MSAHAETGGGGGIPILAESGPMWEFLFSPISLFLQGLFSLLGM